MDKSKAPLLQIWHKWRSISTAGMSNLTPISLKCIPSSILHHLPWTCS